MGVNGYQTVGGSFRRILTQPPGRKTSFRLWVLVFFFFFASVEILLDILADNTKKASSMGTEFARQFDRCSSGLAHPTGGRPDTHFQRSSSHGWKLTYPPKKGTFEHDPGGIC